MFLFFFGIFFPPSSSLLLSLSFSFLTDIRFARIDPPTTFHLLASQGDTGSGSEQASGLEIQAQMFVSFTLEWDGHDMEYLAKKSRSVTNYKCWRDVWIKNSKERTEFQTSIQLTHGTSCSCSVLHVAHDCSSSCIPRCEPSPENPDRSEAAQTHRDMPVMLP